MIQQLRIYEIFEHNKAAFRARFRHHAMRIMKRYGFATMEAAWRGFLSDEELKEIKRAVNAQHGDLVSEIEDRVLMPTAYSPVPS